MIKVNFLLTLIMFLFIILPAQSLDGGETKYEVSVNENPKGFKNYFETLITNCYTNKGKYFIVKCSRWISKKSIDLDIKNPEIEINLNDTIYAPRHDEHGFTFFVVKKNFKNEIEIGYESSFTYSSFSVTKITIEKGSFIIRCSKQKKHPRLIIDGLEISAESARKHIAKGKFYILLKFDSKIGKSGLWDKPSECLNQIYKKFGFYRYVIDDCVPTEFYYQQIEEYNTVVFNYLMKHKGLTFENYSHMKFQYNKDLNECYTEENKKINAKNKRSEN